MKRKEYGQWLQERLGLKAQKLPVHAGMTCPNRDGRLGRNGCTFCSGSSFVPAYCQKGLSIAEQIEAGKQFFNRKYPSMSYLAYFQSYTNTYADLESLKRLYEDALSVEDVVGIVIGTRPDCVSPELLDYLADLSRRTFVMVEYGIESASDETLCRIHRGHDFSCSEQAVRETAVRRIHVGGHIILGFPWENHEELMRQASMIGRLPLDTLKIHQLQVLRGTEMAQQYETAPWPMPTAQEYAELVSDYVSHLPERIVLERFVSESPRDQIIAPKWGLKPSEFLKLLKQ